MQKNKLEKLKKRDFFSKENNFVKNSNIQSRLEYGEIDGKPPFLTIIMPTYKRSDLISDAINSVINQKGFDDFELLIVDNENIQNNETEKVIKSFESDKIIYYKNEKNIGIFGNWNRCLELARSKWVCMLHDDDILKEDHLSNMINIIKKNEKIDFLCCNHMSIDERNGNKVNIMEYTKSTHYGNNNIIYLNYKDYNFGFKGLLLGAIFNREKAIKIGGFYVDESLIEDYFFVSKYAYYYGVYKYSAQLYGYRWRENLSLNNSIWQDQIVYEYYLYRYISLKRSMLIRPFFVMYSKYRILKLIENHKNGTSFLKTKLKINEKEIFNDCQFKSVKVNIIILLAAKLCTRLVGCINRRYFNKKQNAQL